MSNKKYYVYLHKYASGPKKGQVFYVGKGQGNRAYTKSSRSRHWRNIVNKYGLDVCISARFEREECSFSFERAVISFIGRGNLINLTDGGEGISGAKLKECTRVKMSERMKGNKYSLGFVHSEETRRKMSKSRLGDGSYNYDRSIIYFHHRSGDVFIGTMGEFRRAYGLSSARISEIRSGKLKSSGGWSTCKDYAESLNERMCEKVFNFSHEIHGDYSCTISFISKTFGLDLSALYAIASGKRRIHKGWTVNAPT